MALPTIGSNTGGPDFDAKALGDRSTAVVDNGEIAERINGAGGALYRGGHWVFADGFEYGALIAHWSESGTGTPVFSLDTSAAWNGANSAKLVTSGANGDSAQIARDFALYPTRMGFELMFKLPIGSPNISQQFRLNIIWNRASNLFSNSLTCSARISFNGAGVGTLELFEDNGGAGAFVVRVNPLEIKNVVNQMWHSLKVVADFNTGLYSYLYLDYLKFDFSARSMGKSAAAASGQGMWVTAAASITTTEAISKTANIDDVIFTADEP